MNQTAYPESGPHAVRGAAIASGQCPGCHGVVVLLRSGPVVFRDGAFELDRVDSEKFIYPPSQRIAADSVPQPYRQDLNEANAIAAISPRASAALSRRLLQTVLRERFQIRPTDLGKEIDEFLQRTDLPEPLAKSVDAIRQVGNFAAHPTKSARTGEIVDVEPSEAEWLLDACEWLLEYAFVQPALIEERRIKLNTKLEELGKRPLKG